LTLSPCFFSLRASTFFVTDPKLQISELSHVILVKSLPFNVLRERGAKGLNRDGIQAPAGGKWGKQRIHKIMTNETYTGCLVWGRNHKGIATPPPVRKEGAWPALIDKQMFQQVQSVLKSHAPKLTHPRVTSSSYLLSGLIRCQKCRAAYIGYGAKSGRHHYYVCGTTYAKGKEVCPSQHLPKDNIEQFVVEKIKGYILTDEHLTKLVEIVNEELDGSINDYKDQIKVIDSQLDDWQGRLERLYDFVETKEIEPTRMAKRVIQVQDKIEELRKTKLDIQGSLQAHRQEPLEPSIVLQYVKELQCLLEESDICERRAFLRSFIESIQVDDGTITLNYTVPLPPDSSRQETVSVLGIVPTGPPEGIRTKHAMVY
jgi:site-specific DNA recombinase